MDGQCSRSVMENDELQGLTWMLVLILKPAKNVLKLASNYRSCYCRRNNQGYVTLILDTRVVRVTKNICKVETSQVPIFQLNLS